MRPNRQRGMTLIELLVSMAVTSMLLVALGGVFVNVSSRYQGLADRLNNASTGSALAASLQADSHRYVVCHGVQLNRNVDRLDLCPATAPDSPVVRYDVSSSAPYVITRQSPIGGAPSFMARSLSTFRPVFTADCFNAGGVVSGHIHVYYLRIDDGAGNNCTGNDVKAYCPNFMVYYAAPWTSSCGS